MFFETVDVMPEAPAYELFNHPQSSMGTSTAISCVMNECVNEV